MSEQAGQEGPTPDFIPGWFIPRPGNVVTAEREAVRFIGTQDFPINFLRDGEAVWLPKPPQVGVCIGQRASGFCLGVPPGYWIVRGSDGRPQLWREEDFEKKWVRNNGRDWISPVERLRDNPHLPPEVRKLFEGERPAWAGEPPAEGTRRAALIRDAIYQAVGEHFEDHGGRIETRSSFALKIADAVESALLKSTIDDEDRDRLRLPRTMEIEAIGWISAELAARSGAWEGNAPDWFPEPPEWLELWDKALAAVRQGALDKEAMARGAEVVGTGIVEVDPDADGDPDDIRHLARAELANRIAEGRLGAFELLRIAELEI